MTVVTGTMSFRFTGQLDLRFGPQAALVPAMVCVVAGQFLLARTPVDATLLEAGVHPKLVQDLLGHSTIAVTLNTYSHVAPALHQQAAAKLQSCWSRQAQIGY